MPAALEGIIRCVTSYCSRFWRSVWSRAVAWRKYDQPQTPEFRANCWELPDFDLARAARRKPPVFTAWPFDAAEARHRQEETSEAILFRRRVRIRGRRREEADRPIALQQRGPSAQPAGPAAGAESPAAIGASAASAASARSAVRAAAPIGRLQSRFRTGAPSALRHGRWFLRFATDATERSGGCRRN